MNRRVLIPACLIAAVALAELEPLLRWDAALISAGEIWRVVTGHFTHAGWGHALQNAAGLVLLAMVLGATFSGRVWLVLLSSLSIAVGVGLLVDGTWTQYVGFSGVLHGLVAAPLAAAVWGSPAPLGPAPGGHWAGFALAVLWLKVLAELGGWLPGVPWLDAPVAASAHAWGLAAGTALGVCLHARAAAFRPLTGSRASL